LPKQERGGDDGSALAGSSPLHSLPSRTFVPAFRAAQLANHECQQRFRRRPFTAWTYPLSFHHGRFHWGRLDPAGINGYSAEVSFPPWSTESKVQVYFSIDEITMTPAGKARGAKMARGRVTTEHRQG